MEEKDSGVVLLMRNVKLSPCGFLLRKRGKLNLANFRLKLDRSENPTSKIYPSPYVIKDFFNDNVFSCGFRLFS